MSEQTKPELQQFDLIEATFAPRRTDDLKPNFAPAIGTREEYEVMWFIESGPYDGEWACSPLTSRSGWVPSGDLEDITPVSSPSRGDQP